ncbi:MAG: thioredoxin domain-containing protein [Candidatus Latescibacterota bacterium]|jgi:uncharacterized protein YyaL (SSP411 family)
MLENRLALESSPYLRQHAHNPVEWYPWGDEALEKACDQERVILLSIGYSACHWCHVMERESFENEAIAAIMNEHFINIKVDREERPDIDEVYMTAVQAMTGSGGWPMTVFLTPDLKPFYGGTYYPPEDRYGRPGFPKVLRAVAEYFRENRQGVNEKAGELMRALQDSAHLLKPGTDVGEDLLDAAYGQIAKTYDADYGGFGAAPKFPASMSLAFLLRYYRRRGEKHALVMVENTLRRMARGGIYDQLGGGFHRYSVDERWSVPHFEKMLYDNSLLCWVYLEALQTTGDDFYAGVARDILDYSLREMTRPEGGFYSTQDADSQGEEGVFFSWLPEEIEALLGEEDAAHFMRYYGVEAQGNFEHGRSLLHVEEDLDVVARQGQIDVADLERIVQEGREKLFVARQLRVAPARDDKIVVAWNGFMISAMGRAYQVLGDERYLRAAEQAADFILGEMRGGSRLLHTSKDGVARIAAFQDDYAALSNGLLDLYEATFDAERLEQATQIAEEMVAHFWDDEDGGFFYAGEHAKDLIMRSKNPFDNATPAGNSLAALVALRLGAILDSSVWRERGAETIRLFAPLIRRAPASSAQMLCALDYYLEQPHEIALVGTREQVAPFYAELHALYCPNKIVVVGDGEDAKVPMLADKDGESGGRAYVCRDSTCSPPLLEPAALVEYLQLSSV